VARARRAVRRAETRPAPLRRIRFHGQDLEFSPELKYLVADETAGSVVGDTPRAHETPREEWKESIAEILDLFDDAGRGIDGYEWLVTPNPDLADQRPLDLIRVGRGPTVLSAARKLLAP
jgi:hypothetical protein